MKYNNRYFDGQVLILECANGTSFEYYLNETISNLKENYYDLNKELIQMFFQIFYTIIVFNNHGVTHYDLHLNNIFLEDISKLPDKKNKFIYFINETEYVIINLNNYLVKIFDWDFAYIDGMTDAEKKSRDIYCGVYGICDNVNVFYDLFQVIMITIQNVKSYEAQDIDIFKNLIENVFKKFVKNNNSTSPIENPIMRFYLDKNNFGGLFDHYKLCNLKQNERSKLYDCNGSFDNKIDDAFHEPHILLNLLIDAFPQFLLKKNINDFDDNYYPNTHKWDNNVFGISKQVLEKVKSKLLRKKYQKVQFDNVGINQKMYNSLISSSPKSNDTIDENKFQTIINNIDFNNFIDLKKKFYNINLLEAENIILSDKNAHKHHFYFKMLKLFSALVYMNVYYMDQTINQNPIVVCQIKNLVDTKLTTVYDHNSLFKEFKTQFSDETFKETINKEYNLNIKFVEVFFSYTGILKISYCFASPTLHVLAPLEYISKKMSERYMKETVTTYNYKLFDNNDIQDNKENSKEIPSINDTEYIKYITNSLKIDSKESMAFVLKISSKEPLDLFMAYVDLKRSPTEISVQASICIFSYYRLKISMTMADVIKNYSVIEKVKNILSPISIGNTKAFVTDREGKDEFFISYKTATEKDWSVGLKSTMNLLNDVYNPFVYKSSY